jgi:NAD(P)-dependent dehydrogenase (short-subunit alcohol dehydrogenase family)
MATVLITGANRGIGLGLAKQYVGIGDKVIAACRNPDMADALQRLSAAGDIKVVSLDVGDNQSVADLAHILAGQPIDVLINNAGVGGGQQQSLLELDEEQWLHVFRINTMAPVFVTRALLPNLVLAAKPKVMIISSQLGAISYPNIGVYAYESSKAAINKVVRGMAQDFKEKNIAVFAIHPGWVKTDMGGANAAITVDESTAGLVDTFAGLSMANTGTFWQWDGTQHEW